MQRHPVAWGLDIGHSSIKAAKLIRTADDKVTVHAYAIEPIVVPEQGDREEAVVRALEQMALREEFGSTPVLAALSGRQVFSRTINVPVINPKTMGRMVELEARQQIPGDFDAVEWGYHMSPGADGSSYDVALFAVKKEIINDLLAKSKRTGINLVGLSVSSLALYNFVRYDQVFPGDETIIILDIGAENTDLVFYKGDQLAMASLSVSGNDITRVFQKKFRLNSFDEAERLKRDVATSGQAEKVLKVIEPTLAELISEVQRRIGFYKNQNTGAKLENLVISGSTFKLPGLPEHFAERMRYTVNILEDLDKIQVAKGLEREHFLHDLQSLGVAMGLALQGVGAGLSAVNLMPNRDRIEQVLRQKRWAPIAAILMLSATAVATYMITQAAMRDNLEVISKIKEYAETNEKNEKSSRAVLELVGPRAVTLAHFAPYGRQQGLNQAVYAGVIGVVEDLIREYGQVGETGKRTEDGGDPALQGVYLDKIEIPPWDPAAGGPFSPLAAERVVTVVLRVPDTKRLTDARQQLEKRLLAIPTPAAIAEIVRSPTLFAGKVQMASNTDAVDTFHFLDPNYIDPETGDTKPIIQERKQPVQILTFHCHLPAGT